MDRKLWTRLVFIICILALAIYYIGGFTGKNLKGGIDLIGGTSQLWEIDTTGMSNTDGLAEEMIKVQRKRVDPDNVQNLIWRAVGNTRLEVQMPQSSEKNRETTQNYLQAVENLEAENIVLSEVHEVLRLPVSSERDQKWKELLGKYPDYKVRLEVYSKAHEELTKAYGPW